MTDKRLTDQRIEVLGNLVSCGEGWWRPMDCGGTDASHHSATLRTLARLGLVDRRDRGSLMGRRAVWLYQVNAAGKAAWAERQRS